MVYFILMADLQKAHAGPRVTVDILIESEQGIVLIKRKYPPPGWAIPGGFVEYGETLEQAAIREAKEETGLDVELVRQFHTYSDPSRDTRHHTVSTVFVAHGRGTLCASDDAAEAGVFGRERLPEQIAFDHREILEDYYTGRF